MNFQIFQEDLLASPFQDYAVYIHYKSSILIIIIIISPGVFGEDRTGGRLELPHLAPPTGGQLLFPPHPAWRPSQTTLQPQQQLP